MPSRGNGGEKGGPKSPGRCLQGRGPHAAGTEGSRGAGGMRDCCARAPARPAQKTGPARGQGYPRVSTCGGLAPPKGTGRSWARRETSGGGRGVLRLAAGEGRRLRSGTGKAKARPTRKATAAAANNRPTGALPRAPTPRRRHCGPAPSPQRPRPIPLRKAPPDPARPRGGSSQTQPPGAELAAGWTGWVAV